MTDPTDEQILAEIRGRLIGLPDDWRCVVTVDDLTALLRLLDEARAERNVWQNKWRHYKDRCQEAGVGVSELLRAERDAAYEALRWMVERAIWLGVVLRTEEVPPAVAAVLEKVRG